MDEDSFKPFYVEHPYLVRHDVDKSHEQNYERCVEYVVDEHYQEKISKGELDSYVRLITIITVLYDLVNAYLCKSEMRADV